MHSYEFHKMRNGKDRCNFVRVLNEVSHHEDVLIA